MHLSAPIGPIGQSAAVLQVGAQIFPIGEPAQVQPSEPCGQAPVQSDSMVQEVGPPIIPPPMMPMGVPR
jgi:hypothetical protein